MARTDGLNPLLEEALRKSREELAAQGITLGVVSGRRTVEEQAHLKRKKGKMAAEPSPHAPHVAGNALDLSATGKGVRGVSDPRVRAVLQRNGLVDRVKNEPWHWEVAPDRVFGERKTDGADSFFQGFKAKGKDTADSFFQQFKQPAAPKGDGADSFFQQFKKAPAKSKPIFEQYPPSKAKGVKTIFQQYPPPKSAPPPATPALGRFLLGGQDFSQPPKGVKPGLDIGGSEMRARAAQASVPKVAGAKGPHGPANSPELAAGRKAAQARTSKLIGQVTATLNPIKEVANSVVREIAAAKQKYGRAELEPDSALGLKVVLRGLQKSHPWTALMDGWKTGEVKSSREMWVAMNKDPQIKATLSRIPGGIDAMAFITDMQLDGITGMAQAKVAGKLAKLDSEGLTILSREVLKPLGLQAAAEKKIPALGRYAEGRRVYIGSREVMNRNSAFFDQYLRSAEDIAEDVRRTSQRYMRQTGGKIRETDRLTGQKKNVFDELVADYMDAGNPGSKYEDLWQPQPGQAALPPSGGLVPPGQRAPGNATVSANFRRERELEEVAKRAAQYGVDFEDVRRIGDRYGGIFDELGQALVDSNLLSAEAYASLKGQYLPRLYLLTHGNPADVKSYLDFLKNANLIGPEELRFARERLQRRGEKNLFGRAQKGPQQFRQEREIAEFEQRSDPAKARALIPEATPAALHGIGSQARAAGEAAGHAEIALNPSWAVKVTPRKVKTSVDADLAEGGPGLVPAGQQSLPGQVPKGPRPTTATIHAEPPEGWVKWEGGGPLSGHYVHPQVDRLLKFHSDPGMVYKFIRENYGAQRAEAYQNLNNFVKRVWVSAPRTAFNNISGNIALGHSTASAHGIERPLPAWLASYAKRVKEVRDASRGGQIPARLQEALLETSILRESGLQVPAAAKRVGSGFGVETPLERLRQKPGEWFQAYGKALYNDPEKAGRYHLYSELRDAGKSVREAEQIVNDAMVTYTDVGPIVRELERNPLIGAPFITFPLKAVVTASKIAVTRPDQFNAYTGERLRNFLDEVTDRKRAERGLKAEAKEKRRKGEVSPFEFPIPPMTVFGQEYGAGEQTLYARAAPLAQFAGIIGSSRGGPMTENIGERLKGVNPLVNLARSVYFNENEFTGFPIVPAGSVPGTKGNISDVFTSGEVAGKYAATVLKAIFPEYADLERTYKAVNGLPEYESLYAPVPRFKAVMLRALTGINIAENLGENLLERAFRVEERVGGAKPTEYSQFALDYTQTLLSQRSARPYWTPNQRLQEIADKYSPQTIKEAVKNAGDRLALVVLRDPAAGAERKRKIREMMDWVYALATAEEKIALSQAGQLTPEQAAPFAGVLEETP